MRRRAMSCRTGIDEVPLSDDLLRRIRESGL
jgi:hypothetical protein